MTFHFARARRNHWGALVVLVGCAIASCTPDIPVPAREQSDGSAGNPNRLSSPVVRGSELSIFTRGAGGPGPSVRVWNASKAQRSRLKILARFDNDERIDRVLSPGDDWVPSDERAHGGHLVQVTVWEVVEPRGTADWLIGPSSSRPVSNAR